MYVCVCVITTVYEDEAGGMSVYACVCGGVYRLAVGDKGTHWLMPARFDRVCRD